MNTDNRMGLKKIRLKWDVVGRVILNAPSVYAKCPKAAGVLSGGLGIIRPTEFQGIAINLTPSC